MGTHAAAFGNGRSTRRGGTRSSSSLRPGARWPRARAIWLGRTARSLRVDFPSDCATTPCCLGIKPDQLEPRRGPSLACCRRRQVRPLQVDEARLGPAGRRVRRLAVGAQRAPRPSPTRAGRGRPRSSGKGCSADRRVHRSCVPVVANAGRAASLGVEVLIADMDCTIHSDTCGENDVRGCGAEAGPIAGRVQRFAPAHDPRGQICVCWARAVLITETLTGSPGTATEQFSNMTLVGMLFRDV